MCVHTTPLAYVWWVVVEFHINSHANFKIILKIYWLHAL